MQWAAAFGHRDVAELLLANKAEVNAKDDDGHTPLHAAAFNGRRDVAELLLANKAEVNARDDDGATPLHYAARQGHRDVAELLLANKAEVNARDDDGATPLELAALNGHRDVAELLRQHGRQDTTITDARIHDAARDCDSKKVKALLKGNPDLVFSKNNSGMTPLHAAAYNGCKDVAELLLANEADVNAKDRRWHDAIAHGGG